MVTLAVTLLGVICLSREIKSKRYAGVYYRELENGDRSYFLRMKVDGKVKRFAIGRKSEGVTEAFCNQRKIEIINSAKFGEDVAHGLSRTRPTEPTFGDLFEWYLSRRELKESTIRHLQILRQVPFWDSRKVSRDDVQAHLDELGHRCRPATVTLRYRQIRAVFRYAIDREKYRYPDPTRGIDLPKSTGARKRYFSPEEIELLLDAVRNRPRLYLFVRMSLCTGARLGTLLSVHADHIAPSGEVRLYNHKSGRWYTGYFDEETMELMRGKRGYVLALKGKTDRVPAQQSIQYPLQEVINRLFNKPDTPREERAVVHTLRHSVATQMMSRGVPIEVISRTLDHSSISTTAGTYAKIAPHLVQDAVRDLWSY